jgi:hypothetical protein
MVSENDRIATAAFREPHPCGRANSSYRNRFWKPLSIKNSGYRTRDPFVDETTTYSAGQLGSIPCKAIISDVLSMALHDLFSLCLRHFQPFTPTPPPNHFTNPYGIRHHRQPGPTAGQPGKRLATAIQRLASSWQRPSSDTTEVAESDPMRQVPQLKPITLNGGLRHGGKPASAGVTPVATAI